MAHLTQSIQIQDQVITHLRDHPFFGTCRHPFFWTSPINVDLTMTITIDEIYHGDMTIAGHFCVMVP